MCERQKVIWIEWKRAQMYSQVLKKLQSMCSKFNGNVHSYEWSGMEMACQEKQVFGHLLGACLYCHMDSENDLGSGSCSTWCLMLILLQIALPRVEERTPRLKLKLYYEPWFFSMCLPRAIGTPPLPAPDLA